MMCVMLPLGTDWMVTKPFCSRVLTHKCSERLVGGKKCLLFFCKTVILVRAHKLVIAARSSNDGCYVASRNRLNCSKAILFMSDHLQEVATSLGSHFYHIWPLFRRKNGLREASRTLVGNNSWTIWRWGYSTCSWRQHNTHHLML